MRVFLYAALLGCAATVATSLHAQETCADLMVFLRQRVALSPAEITAIEHGDAIVETLNAPNKRDVAVLGVIRVAVPRAFYVTRLQDFPSSLRAPTRTRFGIFHEPATAADVAAASVDPADVAALKDCRPGHCAVKLPATEMERFRAQVDPSAADSQLRANTYLRQRLMQYVDDYRARGDSAMVVYDDTGSVHASDAFAALLAQSPYVYQYVPSLQQYLAAYPQGKLDGAREVLFWAADSPPGLKPILSVSHLVVYSPPELQGLTLMAAKQIYANHYFEAAFDLTAIVEDAPSAGRSGMYLLVLRRFRFDDLPSSGLVNIRSRVIGKLRDHMRAELEWQKQLSERAYRSPQGKSD